MRETKKIIEIRGRKFILNKFDPFFGNFIAFKIFSLQSDSNKEFNLELLLKSFITGSYEEYENFTKRILKYCSEILPAGDIPVINSEGNIAILELDTPLMMELFTREMMFNIEGFFEGDPEALAQIEKENQSI